MARVFSVAGLGFGDEGKGATVDWICRNTPSSSQKLVIRYNGGPQCSHAVVLPESNAMHRFHQFGSGTLAGAATYLDSGMIVDPIELVAEAKQLEALTDKTAFVDLYMHPRCPVSTIFHRLLNQAQSKNKTDTCGFGVGVVRALCLKYGAETILTIENLYNMKPPELYQKLKWLRDAMVFVAYEANVDATQLRAVDVDAATSALQAAAEKMFQYHRPLWRVPEFPDVYVFEGAQGFLLDQDYGFQPHTTWSDLSSYAVVQSMKYHNLYHTYQRELWGVVRSYATRHGDGPLPTESDQVDIVDQANPHNKYQGYLRSGLFDSVLFRYAVKYYQNAEPLTGIVINHMDQYPRCELVVDRYGYCGMDELDAQWTSDYYPCRQTSEHLTRVLASAWQCSADQKSRRIEESAFAQYVADLSRKPVVLIGRGPTHADRTACNIIPVSLEEKE
jgi:adenylosuccinate synthase